MRENITNDRRNKQTKEKREKKKEKEKEKKKNKQEQEQNSRLNEIVTWISSADRSERRLCCSHVHEGLLLS